MNKQKAKAQKAHELLTHLMCTLECLDSMSSNSQDAKDMQELINELIPKVEDVIDGTFKRSSFIRSNTYFLEMQKKFETIVRKNYVEAK